MHPKRGRNIIRMLALGHALNRKDAHLFKRVVSEVIGPLPQIAPKKHGRRRCGKVEAALRKTGMDNGAKCPLVSVVLGDVIDIGESAWRRKPPG